MKLVLALSILLNYSTFSIEPCSRTALINYQKILVDVGSYSKGEGLRFYLERDPEAKKLLDEYQEKSKPSILSAGTSTLGSLMVLTSLFSSGKSNSSNTSLAYGGIFLITISYLTSKTLQYNNENILNSAINIYNKRNSPQIIFAPFSDGSSVGAGVGLKADF